MDLKKSDSSKHRKPARRSGLNPLRQVIYVAIVIVAMAVGYFVVQFFNGPSDKSVKTSTVIEKTEPNPWYKNRAEAPLLITAPDSPLTHYEEALTNDVYEHPENGSRPKPSVRVSRVLSEREGASRVAMAVPETTHEAPAPKPEAIGEHVETATSAPAAGALRTDGSEETRLAAIAPQPAFRADETMLGPGKQKPAWLLNAVHADLPEPRPMIAIVIDDIGIDRKRSRKIIDLSPPLTVSFLPYTIEPKEMAAAAREKGHELMVHVSMEPSNPAADPGPNVLMANHERGELIERLNWALTRFDGYVGVNNHMGSRFTADPAGMATLMEELKGRGLLFLDSRTSPETVGGDVAALYGVPYAERNVFIDNQNDVAAVHKQLQELETLARRKGYAVGIGHPRDATIEALHTWLPALSSRGIALVPLSRIVTERENRKNRPTG